MFITSKMLSKSTHLKGRVRRSDFFNSDTYINSTAEEEESYSVDREFMTEAYRVNSWIRAIVDSTVERCEQSDVFPIPLNVKKDTKSSGYPDSVKRNMETVARLLVKPNSGFISFSALKKAIIRDVMIYDEAGLQVVRATTGKGTKIPYELYANVSGEELYVNAKANGEYNSDKAFVQVRGGKIISTWKKYEMMNFIKNTRAGYVNGLSPIESIAGSILGDIEAMNYNMKFFENNARPNIAFLFNNLGFGPGKNALERAKKWYYTEHRGKPHLPLFMGTNKGDVKLQELTVPNKDMEFSNWQLMLLSRIMSVYGMQPMVLGILTDTTGKLNSEVQTEQYKRNAIIPLIKLFCSVINCVLIWGDDNFNYDDIYLTSSELDIDDEEKKAKIWEIFLRTGVITINQVRDNLQMPPVEWGDLPFVPLNFSPLDILTDYQRSRIEANLKNATNDGIDNNVDGVDDKNKKDKKDSKNKKGLDAVDPLSINYKFPTGLESMESDKIMDAVTKIIKSRESRPKYFVSAEKCRSLNGVIGEYGLEWKTLLKKK